MATKQVLEFPSADIPKNLLIENRDGTASGQDWRENKTTERERRNVHSSSKAVGKSKYTPINETNRQGGSTQTRIVQVEI